MDIILKITFNPQTGQVSVDGPVEQKLLCFGLLELAKDAVRNFVPSPIIQPLNGGGGLSKVVN
jgi:hypothetical protein